MGKKIITNLIYFNHKILLTNHYYKYFKMNLLNQNKMNFIQIRTNKKI
jgi:hypothetical protein